MLRSTILLCVMLMALAPDSGQGCTCLPSHPQSQFCSADFAAKIYVLNVRMVEVDKDTLEMTPVVYPDAIIPYEEGREYVWEMREYSVRVIREYKSPNGSESRTYDKVYSSEMCGVVLEVGRFYFMAGHINQMGEMELSACSLLYDVTNDYFLSSRLIAENMMRNWRKGCQSRCQICTLGNDPDCEPGPATPCHWAYGDNQPIVDFLSYCAPNSRSRKCEFRRYDVETLARDGKHKFRKRTP